MLFQVVYISYRLYYMYYIHIQFVCICITYMITHTNCATTPSKAHGHLQRSLLDTTVALWIPLTCLQTQNSTIYNQVKQECSEATAPCIPRLSQHPLLVKKQQSVQHTVQYSGDTFTDDVQFLVSFSETDAHTCTHISSALHIVAIYVHMHIHTYIIRFHCIAQV